MERSRPYKKEHGILRSILGCPKAPEEEEHRQSGK